MSLIKNHLLRLIDEGEAPLTRRESKTSMSYNEFSSIRNSLDDASKIFPRKIQIQDKIMQLVQTNSTYSVYNYSEYTLSINKQLDEELKNKITIAIDNIYPDLKEDVLLGRRLKEMELKNIQYSKAISICLNECRYSNDINKDGTIYSLIPNYTLYKSYIKKCLNLLNDIDLLVNHYDFNILSNDNLFANHLSIVIFSNESNLNLVIKDFDQKIDIAKQMKEKGYKPYKIIGDYANYFLLVNERGLKYTIHKSTPNSINENILYANPSSL